MQLLQPNRLASSLAVLSVACTGEVSAPPTSSTAAATTETTHARRAGSSSVMWREDAPFDPGAAARALGSIHVEGCRSPGGPTGAGHVTVTFENDGTVSKSVVDAGPFPETSVAGCLAALFRTAVVPPFSGGPVRVGKSFTLP